jgi:hypothetical protein
MSGDLEIKFDPASLKRFHEGMEKFYKTGPEAFGKSLVFVRAQLGRHVEGSGFSRRGGSSIGIGPGLKYGHVADSLQNRSHNIGWGGYIRINFRKGGKGFVARFHEFGTGAQGRMPNRYSKGGRFYFAKGTGPGQGKNLPARHMMGTAYSTMDQTLIERALSDSIDKVLK